MVSIFLVVGSVRSLYFSPEVVKTIKNSVLVDLMKSIHGKKKSYIHYTVKLIMKRSIDNIA